MLGAVWLLVVLYLLLGLPLLRTLAVGCLAGFLVSAVPRASLHIRVLFLVGAVAAGWSVLVVRDWAPVLRGLEAGIIMGAFFPTLLLLRSTADESPLLAATRERIERWSERQQEVWVQAVSHLLGSFLMIGGYVIARSALPPQLPEARRVRLAESATLGLGLAGCWSPFFVASAIASQLVPSVSAWQLVVLGLGIAVIGWTLSRLMFFRGLDMGAPIRSVVAFAIPSAALVGLVIALSLVTGLRNLEAITLIVPVVCLGYLATVGRQAAVNALRRVPPALARLSDEVIVFTTAMCLGAVVAGSDAGKGLSQLLGGLAEMPLLLIFAEVALIVAAGFAGVHPMISVTLMLPVLVEAHRQLADLVVAYIVVLAWMLSSLVAIWTLPVASAATNFDVPVRRLALGRNLRFMVVFGVCGCFALAALNWAIHRHSL